MGNWIILKSYIWINPFSLKNNVKVTNLTKASKCAHYEQRTTISKIQQKVPFKSNYVYIQCSMFSAFCSQQQQIEHQTSGTHFMDISFEKMTACVHYYD